MTSMISKIDPSRYADTGFSVADTPPGLNAFLFQQMMRKSGSERLIIGCQMTDSARQLVWSGIPSDLPDSQRRKIFMQRFYGETLPSAHPAFSTPTMKPEDRYHRFVQWSDEDECYIGY